MNGQMPTPQNQQPIQSPSPLSQSEIPKEKKGLLKVFDLLGVALIEISLVGIVISLLFGTLNYFNILPISQIFPNQLGFLPHKPYEQPQQYNPEKSRLNRANRTGSTTSTPAASTAQAKQTLLSYLPTILSQPIIPNSDIKLTQDKGIKETFSTSWDTKEGTVSAIIVLNPNGQGITQSYISLSKLSNLLPTIDLAKNITSQLFSIQPNGKWACKPVFTTMTYCENFWEEADGTRRGLGMEGLFTQEPNLINGQSEALIIFCEHSKDSKLYSWKSCQFEFAQTGVVQ